MEKAIESLIETMKTLLPIVIGLVFLLAMFKGFTKKRGKEEDSSPELSDHEKQMKELRNKIIR